VCLREKALEEQRVGKWGMIAAQFGRMADNGRAYLASLSDGESDDELDRQINERRAKQGKRE
jgi:hypothetical protein